MNFRGSLDEVRRRVYFDPGCAFATSHVVQTQPQNAAKRTSARQRRQTGTRFCKRCVSTEYNWKYISTVQISISLGFNFPFLRAAYFFFLFSFFLTNRFYFPVDFSFVHQQRNTCLFARRPKLIIVNLEIISPFFSTVVVWHLWELKL